MEDALIFHLTHGRNLHGILAAGGLWSPNHMPAELRPQSIAHEGIQDRRARKVVPAGPGGVLHDYVPFYFGERSPMLYANHMGFVAGNPDGQRPLVHLVSTVERVVAQGLEWVFTDGHAVMDYTWFFDDLAALDEVDWAAVQARRWANTAQDPDLKRRKQAEFLVFRFVPVATLAAVLVCDNEVADAVRKILATAGSALPVVVEPGCYY